MESYVNSTLCTLLARGRDVDVPYVSQRVPWSCEFTLVKSEQIRWDLCCGRLKGSVNPGQDIKRLVVVTVIHVRGLKLGTNVSVIVGYPGMLGGDIVNSFQICAIIFVPFSTLFTYSWSYYCILSTGVNVNFLTLDIRKRVNLTGKTLCFSVKSIQINRHGWIHTRS